jgi:tetratricopeptide (TPR) repeat protein
MALETPESQSGEKKTKALVEFQWYQWDRKIKSAIKALSEGDYVAGERCADDAVKFAEESYGALNTNVLTSKLILARAFAAQRKFDLAEPLFMQLVEAHQSADRQDRPAFAEVLGGLASMFDLRGDFGGAVTLRDRALRIFEQSLDAKDLRLAQAMNALAMCLERTKDLVAAERMYKRAQGVAEASRSKNTFLRADILWNLADLYCRQGRLEEAEPLYIQSIAIREKKSRIADPALINTLLELARLHVMQKRFDAAAPHYKRALAAVQRTYGKDSKQAVAVRYHEVASFLK